jgi:hypothetical protein
LITLKFDSKSFDKTMKNIMNYSGGFLDGAQMGKKDFFDNLGPEIVQIASNFIDTNAKVSPETLHHVYEWYKTGSPAARLFDINYTVSNLGLSFISVFRQSRTIQDGGTEPFVNKAKIMEESRPVVIAPKNAQALAFDINGEMIFTKKPVVVSNPGGQTQDGFEKAFDIFFGQYFTQAFLKSSGLAQYFENPISYKNNLKKGSHAGRSAGISTGYRWVANAGVIR